MDRDLLLSAKKDYAQAVEMARQFLYHSKELSFEELLVTFSTVCFWKEEMGKRVEQTVDPELQKAYACLMHLFARYKDTYVGMVFTTHQLHMLRWLKKRVANKNVSNDLKNAICVFADVAKEVNLMYADDFTAVVNEL